MLKEKIDVTLDGDFNSMGHVHPLTQTVNEIVEIFEHLGFSLMQPEYSPEVEVEKYNFDLLNDWWHVDELTQFVNILDIKYAYNKAKKYILQEDVSGAQSITWAHLKV